MTARRRGNPPARPASRRRTGPDQVTIQASETPAPDSTRSVNDTVRNRNLQVTAQLTPKAQDNTRIQWRYPAPPDDRSRNGEQPWTPAST
jgi:hypothetical protein